MSADQTNPEVRETDEERELRAAYEAEMRRVTSAEMLLQATVSLLNIGGYRLGRGGSGAGETGQESAQAGRDLEQVRDAIDGVTALLPIIERRHPQELRPLRDALSQLQLAYAREAGTQASPARANGKDAPVEGEPRSPQPGGTATGKQDQSAGQPKSAGPGPAESSGRLWVPGR